jgi:hypothetical protein
MKKVALFISIFLICLISFNLNAKTINVSPGDSIQTAIDSAVSGDIINVAPGDYNEDITIKKGITVEGSGSGKTSITGFNVIPLVTMQDNTKIKGFYLKSSASSNIVVNGNNVIIESNRINAKYTAIKANSSNATIYDNLIDQVAFTAIHFIDSQGQIYNNQIGSVYMNMFFVDSNVQVYRNIINGNGESNNGIMMENTTAIIANNLIYKHVFDGINANSGSYATIINNTFYANETHGIISIDSTTVIMNNIIMSSQYGIYKIGTIEPSISYNNIGNNSIGNYYTEGDIPFVPASGVGEISVDPNFKDVNTGNFELNSKSGCIDKGNPDATYKDKNGTRNNIGAYGGPLTDWIGFFDIPHIFIFSDKTSYSRGDTINITLRMTNFNPTVANMNEFIVFETATSNYLFYPSWGSNVDSKKISLPSRYDVSETLFQIPLQEPLPVGNYKFYTGLANNKYEFPDGIKSIAFKIGNKPNAKFTVDPTTGKALVTIFKVDATESFDDETPKALLTFRWRWEDGLEFTAWTSNKKAQHKFIGAGTKTITLEVQDLDGNVDSTSKTVEVSE